MSHSRRCPPRQSRPGPTRRRYLPGHCRRRARASRPKWLCSQWYRSKALPLQRPPIRHNPRCWRTVSSFDRPRKIGPPQSHIHHRDPLRRSLPHARPAPAGVACPASRYSGSVRRYHQAGPALPVPGTARHGRLGGQSAPQACPDQSQLADPGADFLLQRAPHSQKQVLVARAYATRERATWPQLLLLRGQRLIIIRAVRA